MGGNGLDVRAELLAFCEREDPRLVGALTLYCGDADVAAELAQEALLRAVADWPRVRTLDAPGAWAHRVGMNLAASWYRRRRAEHRAVRRHGARIDAAQPDADATLAVRTAVSALPDRQRRVVVLRFYVGLPLAQTAAALGVSERATAALTYRAVQEFRARLQDLELVVPDGR